MDIKVDCRYFRGDRPCKFACGCERCMHYAPMGRRILIVKLDAIGDVARTTPILGPLRKENDPCYITWLVHPNAASLLRDNPLIEAVLPYGVESLEALRSSAKFNRVTMGGLRESHPHDVTITREAPNYRM